MVSFSERSTVLWVFWIFTMRQVIYGERRLLGWDMTRKRLKFALNAGDISCAMANIQSVLVELTRLVNRMTFPKESLKIVAQVQAYFQNHRQHVAYADERKAGVASGLWSGRKCVV